MPQVGARARPIGRHQRLDAQLLEHLEHEAPRELEALPSDPPAAQAEEPVVVAPPTEPVAERARFATIDRQARKGEKPSDHAPVIIDLAD